jgi:alpha-L-rhamnosidase
MDPRGRRSLDAYRRSRDHRCDLSVDPESARLVRELHWRIGACCRRSLLALHGLGGIGTRGRSWRIKCAAGRLVSLCRAARACSAAAIEARHWDAARRVYVDGVDPVTAKQQPRVSQHANAAIALWGSSTPDRIGYALDRIVDSARLTFTAAPPIVPTGETLDEQEGVVLANTFYSHFVYEALARRGRFGDALRLMRERYGPMLARGATTLWESFGPTASLCHGFSATPTYQLSRHVLGVKPAAPGFAEIELRPHLHDLEFVEGIVPTVRGDVNIHLEKNANGFSLRAQAPKDVVLTVATAPGLKLRSRTDAGKGVVEAAFESAS